MLVRTSAGTRGPLGLAPGRRGIPGPLGIGANAPSGKATTIFAGVLYVHGTRAFRRKTIHTLQNLMKTDTGGAVVRDIRDSGKKVLIVKRVHKIKGWIAEARAKTDDARMRSDGTAGAGSDTVIHFNLDFCDDFTPGELVLGHELIHARRNARGIQLVGVNGLGESLEERAVAGDWRNPEPMTGNALRRELNKIRPSRFHLSPKRIFRTDGL